MSQVISINCARSSLHTYIQLYIMHKYSTVALMADNTSIGFVRLSLSVIKNFEKSLEEATTISKQKVNAEIRDTLACLYLI